MKFWELEKLCLENGYSVKREAKTYVWKKNGTERTGECDTIIETSEEIKKDIQLIKFNSKVVQQDIVTKEKTMKRIMFALILFTGCSESNDYTPSSYSSSSSSSNSFEHNYVKNRMKLEGYSNKDSETAAKAIMKFHEAQKRKQ